MTRNDAANIRNIIAGAKRFLACAQDSAHPPDEQDDPDFSQVWSFLQNAIEDCRRAQAIIKGVSRPNQEYER